MKKITKSCLVIIGVLLLLVLAGVQPAQAQEEDRGPGHIWTTKVDCGAADQNVNQYSHGEVVYIHGEGFLGTIPRVWSIKGQPGNASEDPDSVVASGTISPDSNGGFCFAAYTVANDDGGVYKVQVGFKTDNYHVSYGTASVSVSVGGCAWSVEGGSKRAVSLTITGASVTITRTDAPGSWGPFTTSQIVNLPAGEYQYTWVPTTGYRCVPNGGTFTVAACPPASANVEVLTCQWDGEVSSTDVVLTISNASLSITGPSGAMGPYTSTQTLTLPPGSYTYSWTALPGYSGTGSGGFNLVDCEPGKGEATVTISACEWDGVNGSQFVASLTISNATLTINGTTHTESIDIKLPCGTYPWTWEALQGFEGSGGGLLEVEGCEPAEVNVVLGACEWDETSITPVTINITGATLHLFEGGIPVGTFGPGNHVANLPTGNYTYTWTANEDYSGSGEGSFNTLACEPGKADASVSISACAYVDGNSLTLVTITVSNAELTIDGQTYTQTAELKLLPGDYYYSWVALEGYQGEGDGTLSVDSCEPKGGDDPQPDFAAGGSGPSLIATLMPAFLTVSEAGLAWVLIKRKTIKKI